MQGPWPDFFIIGAMKAGTTSLYNLLRKHPGLFMPREKEPHYFLWSDHCSARQLKVPGRRGMISADHWMVVHTERQYRDLFRKARDGQLIGEASTFYLPDPHVAERIRSVAPRAKIFAILRDPVERAYSAYTFQQSLGLEPAPTFEAAIEAERRGDRNDWLYGWRHLHCSTYARQLQRYHREFGEDAVTVLDFDTLKSDPQAVLSRILAKLGLDPAVELEAKDASNRTTIPVSPMAIRAKFLLTRPNVLKDTVKILLPRSVRREMRDGALAVLDRFSVPPRPMTEAQRSMLRELCAPDLVRLERMLGRDFASWLHA